MPASRMVFYMRSIFTVLIFAAVLNYSASGLFAQDSKKETSLSLTDNTKPELYGHQFISTSLVEGPYMNTSFELTAGVGTSSDYDIPLVINNQDVKGLFGQLTYGSLYIKYQQKIKDWMSFYINLNMKGKLGSQTISLMTEGINIGSSFSVGWNFKTIETKKFMLSTGLTISSANVTVFNLNDFITKIIETGEIDEDNKLVRSTNLTAALLGFKGAYAFNRSFGIVGNALFGYGESASSVNRGYFNTGVCFDFDMNPHFSFPLGFALGYNWNNFSQTDVNFSNPQNIIFKVNYTGKRDFDLGVETNAQLFNLQRPDGNVSMTVLFMKASIAYYF